MNEPGINKEDVAQFWEAHPLGSYEQSFNRSVDEFYDYLDAKKNIASKFSRRLQDYKNNSGKKVLELGCGPGWNIKNLAYHGAKVAACDITPTGAGLARTWLKKLGLNGAVCVGDVEFAPFKSNYFDFVLCDGVLHHTPGIESGLAEFYRTMKPGGRGLLSVYYQNVLLRGFMFSVTKFFLRLIGVKFLGGKRIRQSMTLNEFGGFYDGPDNVLGKIYSRKDITELIKKSELKIKSSQLHYFPTPFIPGGRFIPDWFEYILGRLFGTMIYFQVTK
jgi:SAM-dependent methyltransferase